MAGPMPWYSREGLEAAVVPPTDALAERIARARAGFEGGISNRLAGAMNGFGETQDQFLARRAALAPGWDAALRAQGAARADQMRGYEGQISALLARLRGVGQMPPAIMPGSLESVVNGRPVQNPNPSITPPPMIGSRG